MADIDRIRARYNAWYADDLGRFGPGVNYDDSDAWTAIVREDVPALLAEVERLRAEYQGLVAMYSENVSAARIQRDRAQAEVERLSERIRYYRDSEIPVLRHERDGAVKAFRRLALDYQTLENSARAPSGEGFEETR